MLVPSHRPASGKVQICDATDNCSPAEADPERELLFACLSVFSLTFICIAFITFDAWKDYPQCKIGQAGTNENGCLTSIETISTTTTITTIEALYGRSDNSRISTVQEKFLRAE